MHRLLNCFCNWIIAGNHINWMSYLKVFFPFCIKLQCDIQRKERGMNIQSNYKVSDCWSSQPALCALNSSRSLGSQEKIFAASWSSLQLEWYSPDRFCGQSYKPKVFQCNTLEDRQSTFCPKSTERLARPFPRMWSFPSGQEPYFGGKADLTRHVDSS